MNFLKGVSVYLSGAIEACQDKGTTWRQRLTPQLEKFLMKVWDPLVKPDWMLKADGSTQISWKQLLIQHGIDSKSLYYVDNIRMKNSSLRETCCSLANNCNVMIIKIDKATFTVGTWEEVVIGQRRGIPMFFLCPDDPIPSMWLLDMMKAYKNYKDVFFQTEEDLLNHLRLIDKGITEVDRIAWIFKTYKGGSNV